MFSESEDQLERILKSYGASAAHRLYCAIAVRASALSVQIVMLRFLPTPPFQSTQSFVLHLLSAANTSYCQRVTIPLSENPHNNIYAQETK